MKRILTIVAAIILVASCLEQNAALQDTQSVRLVPVKFSAAPEMTRTTYSSGYVYWEESDKVSLFSGNDFATKTELSVVKVSENGAYADFEGVAAAGDSYIAIYPSAEVNTYDGQTSALTVAVPSEQVAVANGFMSGANVAVSISADNTLVFRNIGALVGVKFPELTASATSSVTLRAMKTETEYFGISGTSSVSLLSENGALLPVAGEGSDDYVTLYAPEGGFVEGVTYYMVVYPGEFAGFEVTLNIAGNTIVKSDMNPYTLERNATLTIGPDLSPSANLPADFIVTLDFNDGWPFVEPCVSADDQVGTGEFYTYQYRYEKDGVSTVANLEIAINSGPNATGNYFYDDDTEDGNGRALCWKYNSGSDNGYAYIKIPGIEGRYLKSVKTNHRSPAEGTVLITFQTGGFPSHASPNSYLNASPDVDTEFALPFKNVVLPIDGQHYCLRIREKNVELSKLVLEYSSTEPK